MVAGDILPQVLAQAFLLGLTLALSIGPIALLILAVTLDRGLRAGLACGAGTYALTIVNPLTLLTFGSWLASHARGATPDAPVAPAAAVLAGSAIVQASIAGFAWSLRRWLAHPRAVRAVGAISGAGIAGFGVAALFGWC